mmetsp:Transcript_43443/g.137349  ORF Transcript_43443/g.137349 Transcript_43443/m.137349 type:complete len:292 (-) Transcript_43443:49-924(-)
MGVLLRPLCLPLTGRLRRGRCRGRSRSGLGLVRLASRCHPLLQRRLVSLEEAVAPIGVRRMAMLAAVGGTGGRRRTTDGSQVVTLGKRRRGTLRRKTMAGTRAVRKVRRVPCSTRRPVTSGLVPRSLASHGKRARPGRIPRTTHGIRGHSKLAARPRPHRRVGLGPQSAPQKPAPPRSQVVPFRCRSLARRLWRPRWTDHGVLPRALRCWSRSSRRKRLFLLVGRSSSATSTTSRTFGTRRRRSRVGSGPRSEGSGGACLPIGFHIIHSVWPPSGVPRNLVLRGPPRSRGF